MAGRGPAPKDPNKRARRNADPIPLTVVQVSPASQPDLIEILGEISPATGEPWRKATLRLWRELADFPSCRNLLSAQWSLLARAMILDDALLSGATKPAAEARLQLQKFGIAPDDVARLRIQFAAADEADERRDRPKPKSRNADLRLAD